ncbi:MAG: glycoside hydrolase family 99-like domain-containing protein [Thermoguttaceae bacterium]|nr:glycoside hydrolase family 99-like domain-containing protein [Thermoguttaceae bacterium]MDW8039341.1 glycoside hydrolase family 99-like domain-containing protein [Thermoguttaceae bacterium]
MCLFRLGRMVFIEAGMFALLAAAACWSFGREPGQQTKPKALVGAYYFDGWAGRHRQADDPKEPWAKDAPTHLTRRMVEEFADRKPLWGWRDDTLEIMERQIDLAADHAIGFFAFCWYWHPKQEDIENDPKHTGLRLFLQAKNNHKMQFCLLVANHAGFLITTPENWRKAAHIWLPYLKHPRHLRVGGRPLVIIFNPADGSREGLAAVQQVAKEAGLPGVAIAACGAGDPKIGYTHRTYYTIVPGYSAGSQARKYQELIEAHQKAWHGTPEQPFIPQVTVGWDKRPWETGTDAPGAGWYYPDRTPEAFGQFLESAIQWMDKNPDKTTAERLLLIYAWNELGEGGYLVPTAGDPTAKYLQMVRSVVLGQSKEK